MSLDVLYRKFESKDQNAVADLYYSGKDTQKHIPIYGECYAWFVEDKLKPEGDMRNIHSVYMSNNDEKKSCFWVAELDGKIIGFVGAVPSSRYTQDYVELVRMFVSADVRKLGVGRKLVSMLEEWAIESGYRNIFLSTLSALVASNLFYPSCGFVLRESEEFDLSVPLNLPPPALVVGNYYVKSLLKEATV